jgi:hypothetical protein
MKLINDKLWINLENHLDMTTFDELHEQIIYAISKNAKYIEPSHTPKYTFLNTSNPGFAEERANNNKLLPKLNIAQLNCYTKLSGSVTLGSQLMLRGTTAYPSRYVLKHLNDHCTDTACKNDFDFLFKWIEDQKCFNEYGRTLFWINEPAQRTALHTDYGNINSETRDMFIWLTGKFRKKILIKDNDTGELHESPYRAMIFNNVNWHGSCGHDEFSSWSLRIDGVFNPEWAEAVGINDYYYRQFI